MRVCKQCGVSKELSEFHKSPTCAAGYRVVCKACVSVKRAEYNAANREKILQQKRDERRRNKDKYRERGAAYYEANKDQCNENSRNWYASNRDVAITRAVTWNAENPERRKATVRKNKQLRKDTVKAEYERNKAAYFSRAAARRVSVKQATPSWADKNQIAEVYVAAQKLNSFFTKPVVHVDHIVPLNNLLVCGLHTQSNLEIIPAKRNLSKGNRSWPDIP